ncbi:hypothetical protein HA402_014195 [Bradysia odoriphaga]|nr:hypothetical protein HA402_014195 [Bradysia odoriphaga]
MDEPKSFNSVEEECCYWKELARKNHQECLDVKQELDDFTEGSRQLEAELEMSLQQHEKTIRDLKLALNQLQTDNESLRKRMANTESEYTQLEHKYSSICEEKDRLKVYTRELEQVNDDLERAHRVVTESVAGFEAMLNQAYEKNALLEIEVDEKELLQVKLQRLMDETRDLKQELNVRTVPSDSRSFSEKTNSDNRHCEIETQTAIGAEGINSSPHPIKHSENVLNGNAMTASSKITAINLVAELLRKVNLEKFLCSDCDKFRCICPKPPQAQQMEPTPISTLFRRQKFSAIFPVMSSSSSNIPSTNTNDNSDKSNSNLPETKN